MIDDAWRDFTRWRCGPLRHLALWHRLALWHSLSLRCGPVLWRGLALRHGLALWHSLPLWGRLNLWRGLPLRRRGARCWGWTRRRRSPALSLSVFLRVGAQWNHQDGDPQHGCQLQKFFHNRILRRDHIDRSPKYWRSLCARTCHAAL